MIYEDILYKTAVWPRMTMKHTVRMATLGQEKTEGESVNRLHQELGHRKEEKEQMVKYVRSALEM